MKNRSSECSVAEYSMPKSGHVKNPKLSPVKERHIFIFKSRFRHVVKKTSSVALLREKCSHFEEQMLSQLMFSCSVTQQESLPLI